jgi:uncharacterized protein (DUF608 family)
MAQPPEDTRSCDRPDCCGEASRREFLKLVGLGAAAAMASGAPAMAGPFEAADFARLVPPDKKLSPEWVKSLFAKGSRTVYRGDELKKIGMPVGGLCAGQVYLGGDGRLWHWDIFNAQIGTGDAHYAHPLVAQSPVLQGFDLTFSGHSNGGWVRNARLAFPRNPSSVHSKNEVAFSQVTFCGEYPIGYVEYRDPGQPIVVSLEVFSPFIPLNVDDSSLPATIVQVKIKNVSQETIEARLEGYLGNAVCCHSGGAATATKENRTVRSPQLTMVECSASSGPPSSRPEIVLDDFQKETYDGWQVEGTAFGMGPVLKSKMPQYQGDVGGPGLRVVNSHASAPGGNVGEKDGQTGKLTSRPFTIQRKFLSFWIGGGNHPGKTCINLLVDGKIVRTATGHNDNRMRFDVFDVHDWEGKTARLEIVDRQTGDWGNIGVGRIVMTDQPAGKLDQQPDFGTMALALLEPRPNDQGDCDCSKRPKVTTGFDLPFPPVEAGAVLGSSQHSPVACLTRSMSIEPGKEATATYVIAWHFPNLSLKDGGRYYATRFASAGAVAQYVAEHFDRLAAQTRLWHDTWYDSTLPHWFLDRTLLNACILATSTCHRFRSGRFYGWEGVGCCEGTCTHVWHYAHAVARLFPQLERDLRERTDFGLAFHDDTGIINFRGEGESLATDGQAGCVLRSYREHQMSADDAFLRRNWPKIKKALQVLIRQDADGDGLIETGQPNTLDTTWFGPVAWISSLFLAALRAGEEMAKEVGDGPFARQCRGIFEKGSRNLVSELWNGEYFIQKPDPKYPDAMKSGDGCEIDQVFGQSWAFQVGLGRILDETHVKGALRSLWKYNFTPDVGPFRKANAMGRWYAMPGEGGLLMCTWPKGDKKDAQGRAPDWAFGYFNECMTGFEYQVAGHMIWEGLVMEGLAIARAIHDRYHASRRNPWNEVECGDHYARAMAGYGVYLAACGFEYHGPKGYLAFAPRIGLDDFRAAFTSAEGWGTLRQQRAGGTHTAAVELKWGKLRLKTLALRCDAAVSRVAVTVAGQAVAATHALESGRLVVTLGADAILKAGETLEIAVS